MSGNTPAPPGRAEFDAYFDSAKTAHDLAEERERLTERVAELVTEGNELRALLAEIKAVVLWDGTHQTKIRRVLELLGVFGPHPEPAAVTAGTQHLAAAITRLAIPDEEG